MEGDFGTGSTGDIIAENKPAPWTVRNAFEIGTGHARLLISSTGHNYVEASGTENDPPRVFLIEKDFQTSVGEFTIPSLGLTFSLGSGDEDSFVDAFVEAYAAAWDAEQKLLAYEPLQVASALADEINGEEMLLDLSIEKMDAILTWFSEHDPSGILLRVCFGSTAGTRIETHDAMFALSHTLSPFNPAKMGSALWNIQYEGSGSDDGDTQVGALTLARLRDIARDAATDADALKQSLGGIDPKALMIDARALPPPTVLSRRTSAADGGMTLLDIACGANQVECFRFLLCFCEITPGPESLLQAVSRQANEMVRDVWNRLSPQVRVLHLVSFAEAAAEFHNYSALAWLLDMVNFDQFDEIATFIVSRRLATPLRILLDASVKIEWSLSRCSSSLAYELFCGVGWTGLTKAVPPARLDAWLSAFLRGDWIHRANLADVAPAREDFRLYARKTAAIGGDEGRSTVVRRELASYVLDHVGGRLGGEWLVLFGAARVGAGSFLDEAAAMLVLGDDFEWTRELVLSTTEESKKQVEAALTACIASLFLDQNEYQARVKALHALLIECAVFARRAAGAISCSKANAPDSIDLFGIEENEWAGRLAVAGSQIFDVTIEVCRPLMLIDAVGNATRALDGVFAEGDSRFVMSPDAAYRELNDNRRVIEAVLEEVPTAMDLELGTSILKFFGEAVKAKALPYLREIGGAREAAAIEGVLSQYLEEVDLRTVRIWRSLGPLSWSSWDGLRAYFASDGGSCRINEFNGGFTFRACGRPLTPEKTAEVLLTSTLWRGLLRFSKLVLPGSISARTFQRQRMRGTDVPLASVYWWYMVVYDLIVDPSWSLIHCLILPQTRGLMCGT